MGIVTFVEAMGALCEMYPSMCVVRLSLIGVRCQALDGSSSRLMQRFGLNVPSGGV